MAELNGAPATLDQIQALALTNYGHFTSMRVEAGQVRGLSLHLERLRRDCRKLFDTELDVERVRHHVRHAIGNDTEPTVARVTVFDPALDLGSIGADAEPHILVTARTTVSGPASSMRLQAVSYRRETPQVKHIGLFGALQHRRTAQREGFDDILLLSPDGTICEIATSNIGFVADDQVIWPQAECLAGITMTLLTRARDEALNTKPLALSDLPHMDAAFATNAATGIRAVMSVDETSWPEDHPLLGELRRLYADIPAERL